MQQEWHPTCKKILLQQLFFYTLGIKDPEGFGKKLEENCRNDHYSGQSYIIIIIKQI